MGINWPLAIWSVVTALVDAVTWPAFKIGGVGEATAPQKLPTRLTKSAKWDSQTEPLLGQIFTSNVFGHYILSHLLVSLLQASPDQGRIVFLSSIEPTPSHFSIDDLQGLKSDKSYESSKRLTDILVLTSSLPSTKSFVQHFLSPSSSTSLQSDGCVKEEGVESRTPSLGITLADNEYRPSSRLTPKLYVCHPGICATSIIPLSFILQCAMTIAFYMARLLGSPWHTLTAYKGACAPVWLTLTDLVELEDMEQKDGKGKWGSCCGIAGHERVMRTVVEGWGLGGRMGEGELAKRRGTRQGTLEVTREDREDFEQLGRNCWRQMEALRVEWDGRMKGE